MKYFLFLVHPRDANSLYYLSKPPAICVWTLIGNSKISKINQINHITACGKSQLSNQVDKSEKQTYNYLL